MPAVSERGQTLVEYALILGFIALAAAGAVATLGTGTPAPFSHMTTVLAE